jgi:hypothetical protein
MAANQGQALVSAKTKNEKLTVTSYNLRWYGLGGDLNGSPAKEDRDEKFNKILRVAIPASDVYVFEEVVDKDRLETEVVPDGYHCVSYDHDEAKHQFVVMCASPSYSWTEDPTDDNFAIEDVQLGNDRYRPATNAILLDQNNKPVARIMGVHLKAMPTFTSERQKQIGVIANALKKMRQDIPTMITGDFNSFTTKENGHKVDDVVAFTQIFSQAGLDIVEAKNPAKNTSWSPRYESKLDRFFVDGKWASQTVVTSGFCNDPSIEKRKAYNQHYSDHCPITLEVPIR